MLEILNTTMLIVTRNWSFFDESEEGRPKGMLTPVTGIHDTDFLEIKHLADSYH